MAHFAEIDANNIVVRVLVVPNSQAARGQDFLANDLQLGGIWLQTSYNTRGGVHYLPQSDTPSGEPQVRYNYAGIGYTYDPVRDAFIPPKPHPDALLDEQTCLWVLTPEQQIDLIVPAELTE